MSVEVRLGTVLRYRGYQKDCLGVLNSVSPDLLGPGVCGLTDYINKYSKKVLAFPSGTAGPIIEVTDDVWTAQQLYLALIQGGLREDIARIHSNFSLFPHKMSIKIYPADYSPEEIMMIKRTFDI